MTPKTTPGQAPGERVAARVDADERPVAGADEQAPVVVGLAVGAHVEGHRQRRAGQRRLVEGGQARARVAAAVDVRLDRPHHRLAVGVDAGHVDDVATDLAADERRRAGERHDIGQRLRVGVERGEAAARWPDARRSAGSGPVSASSCWSSPPPRVSNGPMSGAIDRHASLGLLQEPSRRRGRRSRRAPDRSRPRGRRPRRVDRRT